MILLEALSKVSTRATTLFVSLALVAVLSGCGSLNEQYVEADESTYNAIASEYVEYVAKDPSLDEDQKEIRVNTVMSWKARIDEAKAYIESMQKSDDSTSIWGSDSDGDE